MGKPHPVELRLRAVALVEHDPPDVVEDAVEGHAGVVHHPRQLQDALVALGGRHGLNADEVGTCIGDADIQKLIIKGAQEAPATVTGTPTFIVNGQQVDENSVDAIAAAIEAKLPAPAPN